jgi:glycosyltransferase involved in cell wall biosynthesis
MIAPGVGDGLGRTLVESMIVGTPVVAADSGGHRDVIADDADGLLVTADDPEAFAVAACKLLDDPALAAKIAEHAKTRAIREFSIQRHVSEMTEIYVASLGGVGQVCGEGTPREETPC